MMKRPIKGVAVEDLSLIRLPCYGFPKIDGFRCILGEHPMTSRLARFPNEHFHNSLTGLLPANCLLDSEVTVGRRRGAGVLQRTSSGLTSQGGNPDFTLWVFDTFSEHLRYRERLAVAAARIQDLDHPSIRFLQPTLIKTLEQLQAYLAEQLAKGFEGIITRSVDGIYKQGKSTLREQHMLKVKPFTSFEARIKGYYEEEENTNEAKRLVTGKISRSSAKEGKKAKGTLGGFVGIVIDAKGKETGVEVRVGGGYSARQRKDFWAIKDELVAAGALMTCTKQLMGEKDKPRHPNFSSLRPEWDRTDY